MGRENDLDWRVKTLEDRMLIIEHEVRESRAEQIRIREEVATNTALTEDIHGKNAEMYDAFTAAKDARDLAIKVGNGILKLADTAGRVAKPFLIAAILSGSTYAGLKVPEWLNFIFR